MRAKCDALFGDFAQFVQAENLKAAGIGKDRARPRHEAVQSAEPSNRLDSRPQIKMIGIAEKNLDAEFFENVLRHSFHRCRRSHRHKHGGFDLAMGREQAASARCAGARLDSEIDRHCVRL